MHLKVVHLKHLIHLVEDSIDVPRVTIHSVGVLKNAIMI